MRHEAGLLEGARGRGLFDVTPAEPPYWMSGPCVNFKGNDLVVVIRDKIPWMLQSRAAWYTAACGRASRGGHRRRRATGSRGWPVAAEVDDLLYQGVF